MSEELFITLQKLKCMLSFTNFMRKLLRQGLCGETAKNNIPLLHGVSIACLQESVKNKLALGFYVNSILFF